MAGPDRADLLTGVHHPRMMDGMDTSLRGRCQEMSEAAIKADPTLTLVRGFYYDPVLGKQSHWWTVRPDGTIYDLTAGQFTMGGVADWYEEFDGHLSCEECGRDLAETEAQWAAADMVVCSYACYGRLVGIDV